MRPVDVEGNKKNETIWFRLDLPDFEFRAQRRNNIDYNNARRGNMVIVDVCSTMNSDDCLLGPWRKQYLIGIIIKRQRTGPNLPDDDFTIALYEPWKVYDGLPSMPLWAAMNNKGGDVNGSSIEDLTWDILLQLPRHPDSQLPLDVQKALIESNGEVYHKPQRHLIVTNYMGIGKDVVKLKPSYANQQNAGTSLYII
jgi:hypothetical protein